ncbi:MAG: hypothetical protein CMH28_07795 [Micavibrio sp.]|nr:hypothetical protein [Micavibrio sp.]|tara:strand:- start:1639 stop:1833 length:195 start_codon:yes stop_codon:yes gene_type:complete
MLFKNPEHKKEILVVLIVAIFAVFIALIFKIFLSENSTKQESYYNMSQQQLDGMREEGRAWERF